MSPDASGPSLTRKDALISSLTTDFAGAPAGFDLSGPASAGRLSLTGDWAAVTVGDAPDRLARRLKGATVASVDATGIGSLDTAGLFGLLTIAGLDPALLTTPANLAGQPELSGLSRFLAGVGAPARPAARPPAEMIVTRIGRTVVALQREAALNLAFLGELVATLGGLALQPRRLRLAPTIAQMQRAGLDAVPIVAATNFFVGATIAFLGATLLAQFGASVYTIELVGVGVLREFAVLITGVILAGRSASSFTAEIGAMKMNQELDAMEVIGVNPFDALVLPRFFAMLAMTPLLIFAAMLAGILGGLMVVWPVLDIAPQLFLARLVEHVGVRHFWIGMSKAPVIAMVIAAIGCRQGLAVEGDVDQLGRRVTGAVVQALFAIIIIDAAFALLYMELHL